MTYPDFLAGQELTASLLNGALPQYAIKSVNQSLSSSTTPIDDDELFYALSANALYEWELMARVSGSPSADIRVSWSIPVDAFMFRLCLGMAADSANQSSGNGVFAYRVAATQQAYGLPNSGNIAVYERGTVATSSENGDVQMRWSQAVSSGTSTIVGSRSYLKIRRIS